MEPETPSSEIQASPSHRKITPTLIGAVMVLAGFLILLDQYLRTEWLSLTIVPAAGLMLFATGLNTRKMGWIIPGLLVSSVGIGGVILFGSLLGEADIVIRIGWGLASLSAGFTLILFFSLLYGKNHAWWAFLIAGILVGTAYPLITNRISIFVFIYTISLTTGLAFLAWGFFERLLGLLIPGSLLTGIGPGFYLGFVSNAGNSELVQVGVLLTCFGLGWALITLTSRMINPIFLWWPLIPGGILAVVGWGLTIGGNKGTAITLIGNTGSIGLIIFGLYLILLRRGIRK
jgi:hypothetical protein